MGKTMLPMLAATAAVLAWAATPVGATLVIDHTTRSVGAQYIQGGTVVDEDWASGSPPSNLSARVATPIAETMVVGPMPLEAGFARSVFTGAGFSRIDLNAQMNASTADARHELRGAVSETMVGVNLSPTAATLTFSFELEDMFVEIWDAFGVGVDHPNPFHGPSEAIGAELRYEVLRDGVAVYRTVLQYWGGRDDRVPFVGGLAESIEGRDVFGIPVYSLLADFAAQLFGGAYDPGDPGDVPRRLGLPGGTVEDLDLGPILALQTFEVSVNMSARLLLPPFALGAGGRVGIGDPSDLGGFGFGRLGLVSATAVPEPATVVLVLLGMAAGVARRRQGGP